MALIYVVVALIWLILTLRHRSQVLKLQVMNVLFYSPEIRQHCIGAVIALGMIENATLYFDDLGYNISGENCILT